jgi:hypothetical protein
MIKGWWLGNSIGIRRCPEFRPRPLSEYHLALENGPELPNSEGENGNETTNCLTLQASAVPKTSGISWRRSQAWQPQAPIMPTMFE